MRRAALLLVAGLVAGSLLLPSCANFATQEEVAEKEAAWHSSLDALKRYQAELEAENSVLRQQASDLEVSLHRARSGSATEAAAYLEREFAAVREQLQAFVAGHGGVEYLNGPEGPVLRISDHVIFPSGSAQVSASGRSLLAELAGSLREQGLAFRVEGHTDSQQVKVRAKEYPHGNLELSAARAIEVAAVLIEKGLPAERVAVAGFGEWRPVAGNDSAEGRARNRRVEIAVVTSPGVEPR